MCEMGIDTFAAILSDPDTGRLPTGAGCMADLLEEVRLLKSGRYRVLRTPLRECCSTGLDSGLQGNAQSIEVGFCKILPSDDHARI